MLEDEKDVGREGVVVDSRSLSRNRPSRLLAGSALSSDSAGGGGAPASNWPGFLERESSKLLLSLSIYVFLGVTTRVAKAVTLYQRLYLIGCTSPIPMRDNVAARTAQEK